MERPRRVKGETTAIKTGCGNLYLTQSLPEEEYQEVFTRLGKCGGCALSFLDGIGRLITFLLNAGVEKEVIVHAFLGLRCPNPTWDGNKQVLSCLDGIAQILKGETNVDSELG